MAAVTDCQPWLKIDPSCLPSLPASLAASHLHSSIGPGPPLRSGGSKGAGKKDVFFSPSCQGRSRGGVLSDLIDVALGDLNSLM